MKLNTDQRNSVYSRLELTLVLASLTLILQCFPSLWHGILAAIDVRNWSRTVWFVFNVFVLVALSGVHFGPQLIVDWRIRQNRLATERSKHEEQARRKNQTELLNRMQQSRRRRIY
jgi:hypothetical protein